jgi:hypothetical protein
MTSTLATGDSSGGAASAMAIVNQVLTQYGLQSLTTWAWNEITQGASSDQVTMDMYQTPQFQDRFPGIAARQAAGLPAISPASYVSYEDSLAQMENQYGLPQGMLTNPATVSAFIGQDVSTAEVQQRVENGYQAVAYSPPEVRQAFTQYFGPSGDGALAAYFLDPKAALPLLTQQATAAQMGGTAAIGGVQMTEQDAMELAGLGQTESSIGSGIANLEQHAPLYEASVTEQPGSLEEGTQGVESQFGLSQQATQQVIQRQEQREAAFAGPTQPAEITSTGAGGVGAAKPI